MSNERTNASQWIETGGRDLDAAIAGLTEGQMLEQSIDGWSVKDHLGHLGVWHELRFLEIERLAAGYVSAMDSSEEMDETFNEIARVWRASLPLEQVLWELQNSRRRVLDAISSLSGEGLVRVLGDDWPLRTGHESQHAGYIRDWRRGKGW